MAWFKIDDGFYTSRKVLSISRRNRLAAVGLWTLAGNWSARELTDGHVPAYVLEELGATETAIRALVEARLWFDHRSVEARPTLDQASTDARPSLDRRSTKPRPNRIRQLGRVPTHTRRSGDRTRSGTGQAAQT